MKKAVVIVGAGSLALVFVWLFWPPLSSPYSSPGIRLSHPKGWSIEDSSWKYRQENGGAKGFATIDLDAPKGSFSIEITESVDTRPLEKIMAVYFQNQGRQNVRVDQVALGDGKTAQSFIDSGPDIGRFHSKGNALAFNPPIAYARSAEFKPTDDREIMVICHLSSDWLQRFKEDLLCKRIMRTLVVE